jgi:hypothetical protein
MILVVLSNLGIDIKEYQNLCCPPPVLLFRDAAGIVIALFALWYDNIALFTSSSDFSQRFFNAFKNFCSDGREGCGVVLKEWQLFGKRNLALSSPQPLPNYVGIEFAWQRNFGGKQQLSWRIERSRIERWQVVSEWLDSKKKKPQCTETVSFEAISPRRISKVAGIILYYYHIRLTPLCDIADVLRICREIQLALRSTGTTWDTPRVWHHQELLLLSSHMSHALSNSWFFPSSQTPCGEVWAASDASDFAGGYVILKPWYDAKTIKLPRDILTAHIFVKELYAAVHTIQLICDKVNNMTIHLLVDNTAAAGVLRRMFSMTDCGLELVTRVQSLLRKSGCTLNVIHVTSQENPADGPSRYKKVIQALLEKAAKIIEAGRTQHHGLSLPSPNYDMTRKRVREERHIEIEAPDTYLRKLQRVYRTNPFKFDEDFLELANDEDVEIEKK